MNKKTDKEKIPPKEVIYLLLGILLSIVGGFIVNYFTMFSKDLLLEEPFWQSVSATVVIFLFITVAFSLVTVHRIERGNLFNSLLSIWRNNWMWYLPVVILSCSTAFIYLYNNATAAIAVM